MAVLIVTGFTQVNQFRNNANMFQGNGVSNSMTYNTKTNLSVGQIAGNFIFTPALNNVIFDNDLIDIPILDNEVKPPIGPSIAEVV